MNSSALAVFIGLFYGALGLGYLGRAYRSWSQAIMRWNILVLDTSIFIYSLWWLDLKQAQMYAPIPLASTLLVILPLLLAPVWGRRLLAQRISQGSFVLASAFSNIGVTGGMFVCYLVFGLPGLTLASLYLLPYPLLIFTLGFSVAKQHACNCRLGWRDYLHSIVTNSISVIPLGAMVLGAALNLSGFKPAWDLAPLMDVLVKLNVSIACLAIGMTLNPAQLFSPWRPVAAVGIIKFILLPLLALGLVQVIYGSCQPLPAKIIVIQAAMPPAVYSVITAKLFGLDQDLANTLWFSLTLMLIPGMVVLSLLF